MKLVVCWLLVFATSFIVGYAATSLLVWVIQ